MLLALLSFFSVRKAWRFFWLGVAVFAMAYSRGAHTPLFTVAYYLILCVKKFRAASMVMLWCSFATVRQGALMLIDIVRGNISNLADKQSAAFKKKILVLGGIATGRTLLFSMQSFGEGVAHTLTQALSDPQKSQGFTQAYAHNFVPYLWIWWFIVATILALLYFHASKKVSATVVISVTLQWGLV